MSSRSRDMDRDNKRDTKVRTISTVAKGNGRSVSLGAKLRRGTLSRHIPSTVLNNPRFDKDRDGQVEYFELPEMERQKVIVRAVNQEGALSIFRKINAVRTLNKDDIVINRRATDDMNFIKQHYADDKGRFVIKDGRSVVVNPIDVKRVERDKSGTTTIIAEDPNLIEDDAFLRSRGI